MMFTLATCAALVSLAVIPVVKGADHQVVVGGVGILQYNPNQVTANPGDTVTFTFMQENHTATQSTLQTPCQQVQGGFDSGFIPVAADDTSGPFPTAQFTVEDTNPVWVYCRQANHCQQGMVFAINPGSNFAAFQAAATGNSTTTSTSNSTATGTSASDAGVVTVTATVTVSGGQTLTTTYGSYPGSASPTSATSQVHTIVVGGTGKLFYDPSNITAQVGDVVSFQFQQKNHTVTQSAFATPCRSLTLTSTSGQVGFDSGFMPVADNATTFPTYNITVNDTAPIWAYCRQSGHCGSGMVFSVNAVESGPNNFAAFEAAAKQQNGTTASSSLSPSSSTTASSSSSTSKSNANGAVMIQINRAAGITVPLVGVAFGLLL
jgi:plastocyanin